MINYNQQSNILKWSPFLNFNYQISSPERKNTTDPENKILTNFKQKHFQKRSNTNIPLPFLFPFFPNIIEYYIYSHGVQTTTPVVHLQVGNLIPRLSPPLPNNACLAHTFNSFPSILPSLSRPPLLSPRFRRRGRASLAHLSQRVAIIRFRRNEFRRRPVFA